MQMVSVIATLVVIVFKGAFRKQILSGIETKFIDKEFKGEDIASYCATSIQFGFLHYNVTDYVKRDREFEL